jgi:hypothetical protein
MEKFELETIGDFAKRIMAYFEGFTKATADTFAWISIVVLISATIPGFIAVMAGATDKMPPLDVTLMLWTGLLLYFIRSAILKDMLMVVTIGFGFAIQAVMLGLIYFV